LLKAILVGIQQSHPGTILYQHFGYSQTETTGRARYQRDLPCDVE
jgi:hypothetical protein